MNHVNRFQNCGVIDVKNTVRPDINITSTNIKRNDKQLLNYQLNNYN